ncbi:hypothetical protein [Archangium sp.]|uniref:hypothetical protein n=1 Tax=Archangium sp. TaxID=1872627 RepID=UPI003899FC17
MYFGYSYSIPKEEQIRSEFYRHLTNDGALFELEWNTYGLKNEANQKTEIDLVSFAGEKVTALLEIKRIWSLKGWNNKYDEFASDGLQPDSKKLHAAAARLRKADANSLAPEALVGLIIVSFAHKPDNLREGRLRNVLDCIHGATVHELSSTGDQPLCEHIGNDSTSHPVYARLDFLQLPQNT